MNIIWTYALTKIINYLTSKEFIDLAKALILSMMTDETKTGEEKRNHVMKKLKESGFDFGTSLISFVIESLVTMAKKNNDKTILK